MHVFKDAKGQEWEIVIDPVTVKRVKSLLKENLYGLIKDEELGNFFSDPIRVVDVLYVLCRDQCKERKMTDDDFGAAFHPEKGDTTQTAGDVLERAKEALMEELIDFFPQQTRAPIRELAQKGKALGMAMLEKADTLMAEFDPKTEVEKMFKVFEERMSKSSSGNSLDSLGVTLTEP